MGFTNVLSLRTGLLGWNDYEQPLLEKMGKQIDLDEVDELFKSEVTPAQLGQQVSHAA